MLHSNYNIHAKKVKKNYSLDPRFKTKVTEK